MEGALIVIGLVVFALILVKIIIKGIIDFFFLRLYVHQTFFKNEFVVLNLRSGLRP